MHAIYCYFKRSGTSNSVAIHNNITVFIVVWYLHVQPSNYAYSPQLVQQGLNLMRLPSRKDTLHYCYKQHSLITLVTKVQISLHIIGLLQRTYYISHDTNYSYRTYPRGFGKLLISSYIGIWQKSWCCQVGCIH